MEQQPFNYILRSTMPPKKEAKEKPVKGDEAEDVSLTPLAPAPFVPLTRSLSSSTCEQ